MSATAGSARLPTITGCTNSTATCWACGSHDGATHHMVAPAWKRRAAASAVLARSAARASSMSGPSSSSARNTETAACPSARPPSFGGTVRWVNTVNPVPGEPVAGEAQQEHVLEHAAGEPDEPHRPRDPADDLGDGVGHGDVERVRQRRGSTPARSPSTSPRKTGAGSSCVVSRNRGHGGVRPRTSRCGRASSAIAAWAS